MSNTGKQQCDSAPKKVSANFIVIEIDTFNKSEELHDLRDQLAFYRSKGFGVRLVTSQQIMRRSDAQDLSLDLSSTWLFEDVVELGCSMYEVQCREHVATAGSVILDDKIVSLEEFNTIPFHSLIDSLDQSTQEEFPQ